MILEIVLGALLMFVIVFLGVAIKAGSDLEDEKNRVLSQLRNQDRDFRNETNSLNIKIAKLTAERDSRVSEVARVTNKLIEVQNRANLVENDAKDRMEEFKKHPMIACMSDAQVTILAEMLAIHLRQILNSKEEYVN